MLKQFIQSLAPRSFKLSRAVAGTSSGSNSGADSTYARNCETREQRLSDTLKRTLPGITYLSVQDISGGCGAMFEISVEAKEFVGLSTVKQHRLVNEALKSEIAEMHGIRIHTVPSKSSIK
ncbi:hypothetical protein ACJJTC_000188 [Scirpophaga incertulas]